MDRRIFHASIVLALMILSAAIAYAATPNGAQIYSTSDMGRFPTPGPDDVDLQAGNITRINLVSNMSTIRWTGLFGNASGSLKLGDSGGIVMYSWTALGNLVYLSEDTPAWATLADASEADVGAVYTFIASSAADNYTNTFSNAPEDIGSNLFTISSDYATSMSNSTTVWKTYSLTDGANIVFAGKVSSGGQAYNGDYVDYQMLIPEDGTGGDETTTNWMLFIELI